MKLNSQEKALIKQAEAISGMSTMSKIDRILGRMDRKVANIIEAYSREFISVPKENIPGIKRVITALVSEGAPMREALRMINEQLGYSPSFAMVLQWQMEDSEFDANMKLADRARAEAMVDLATEIALGKIDTEDKEDPVKLDQIDSTIVAERKLQVHHLTWLASKLDSNRYGEKKAIDMKIHNTIEDASTDNLEQKLKALLKDPVLTNFADSIIDVKAEDDHG